MDFEIIGDIADIETFDYLQGGNSLVRSTRHRPQGTENQTAPG